MNSTIKSYIIGLVVLSVIVGCLTRTNPKKGDQWEGVFKLKNKGDQQVSINFDYAQGTGLMMMSDLIPIPLKLTEVVQQDDSIYFTVNFRSGPGNCRGKVKADSITGLMTKEGIENTTFFLHKTNSAVSIYDQPKPPIDAAMIINTKSGSKEEIRAKALLESLLTKYDLEPYLYTKSILIQNNVIPHSHPILTLNTADTTEIGLLSTFLHEQMHWYTLHKSSQLEGLDEKIKEMYPKVPTSLPEGASDEQSTYLHILVNYLEFHTLGKVVGRDKAKAQIELQSNRYYKWIYRTILEDEEQLSELVSRYNLHFE